MGDWRGVYRVLVGRPEGKRLLGRPRHRWEDNIKWMFKKWDEEAWTTLIWFRIGTGACGNYPWGFHKMRVVSLLAEDLLLFQEGITPCSLLVI
jgi:hypothetical protein